MEEKEAEQVEEKENNKSTPSAPKRHSSAVDFIPLKRMNSVNLRLMNNQLSKMMVPFTYGYDGSMKTLKKSKIGNRRMSQWNVQSTHDGCSADTVQKSNVENDSHVFHNNQSTNSVSSKDIQSDKCIESAHNLDTEINKTNTVRFDLTDNSIAIEPTNDYNDQSTNSISSKDIQSDECIESAHNLDTDNNEVNAVIDTIDLTGNSIAIEPTNEFELTNLIEPSKNLLPKAASIMYRRRSARISLSRDELGSLFLETSTSENVNDSIKMSSNHSNAQSETNKPIPQHSHNNVVPHVETETNDNRNSETLRKNSRQKTASELLAKPLNDTVKLWQTRNSSMSDPLFYCFDLVEKVNEKTIKVACLMCESSSEPLTCRVGSNSNLKSHLNRKHKDLYEELKSIYEEEKLMKTSSNEKARKDEIQDLILKFIIKERLPLQKVESEHLNRLIQFCLNGKKNTSKDQNQKCFLTRKVASRKIKDLSLEQRTRIKERLKSIKFISATSDVWSRNNRSYIAVSIHYINPEKGTIETEFLACRRFLGSHNNEAVAEKLKSIFHEYGIAVKVQFITTDGAGEYKCAMTRFGDNYKSLAPLLNLSEEDENIIENDSITDEEEEVMDIQAIPNYEYQNTDNEMDTELPFVVNDILAGNLDILLPTRVDCSSHLFDKIGKIDSFNAVLDDDYCDKYTKVMDKLNLLWNVTQSRLKLEQFEKYAECKLVKPHRIRWNKLYDAIERILSINEVKLKAACTIVSIPILDKEDYEFLNEYMKVIKPIAEALKVLEGNQDTFGSYLPVLFGLKYKLDGLEKTKLKFCKPLLQNVRDGFCTRFTAMMDLNNAKSIPLYMAMVTNPSFKLNYLPHNTSISILKKIQIMFTKAAEELNASEEDNHSFERNSSEPVAIAANKSGMIYTDKRRKMTDELFENLLLLDMNKWD